MAFARGVSAPRLAGDRQRARRRSAGPFLAAGLLILVLALLAGLWAYDHGRRDRIASGVRVAGIDIGNLSTSAARARLQSALVAPLARPVTVTYGGHAFTITGRDAGVTTDVDALVASALARSRGGFFLTRGIRELTGGQVHADLPVRYSYDHARVRAFTARVRTAIERPPRNATVTPNSSGALTEVAGHDGLRVDSPVLGRRLEYALTTPGAPPRMPVPAVPVHPAVSTAQLAGQYPAYIIVDRNTFTLNLYQHLRLTRSYQIAVGMQGLETPAGLWHIQYKEVNPPWVVPHDSWAGSLQGQTIPPGPQDPLKARFMAFDGGAGIHGIDPSEYGTIGHTASHGCVRMRIPDVIDLYDKVSVGTPVFII